MVESFLRYRISLFDVAHPIWMGATLTSVELWEGGTNMISTHKGISQLTELRLGPRLNTRILNENLTGETMSGRPVRLAVVLTVVLVLTGVGNLHSQTATSSTSISRSQQSAIDPDQADLTTDLRPILEKMNLREGVNFVTRTADGLQVYAVVQITDLQVKDSSGNELKRTGKKKPKRMGRNPQTGVGRSQVAAPEGETGDDPRCWHCYDKGGQTHCFEIACPFIAAPGTGD